MIVTFVMKEFNGKQAYLRPYQTSMKEPFDDKAQVIFKKCSNVRNLKTHLILKF